MARRFEPHKKPTFTIDRVVTLHMLPEGATAADLRALASRVAFEITMDRDFDVTQSIVDDERWTYRAYIPAALSLEEGTALIASKEQWGISLTRGFLWARANGFVERDSELGLWLGQIRLKCWRKWVADACGIDSGKHDFPEDAIRVLVQKLAKIEIAAKRDRETIATALGISPVEWTI